MENRKLKGKLKEMKVTYKEMAQKLGISETAFNSKINGHTRFSLPEVLKIAECLNLSDLEKIHIFLD